MLCAATTETPAPLAISPGGAPASAPCAPLSGVPAASLASGDRATPLSNARPASGEPAPPPLPVVAPAALAPELPVFAPALPLMLPVVAPVLPLTLPAVAPPALVPELPVLP